MFIENQKRQKICLWRNTEEPVLFKEHVLQRIGSQMTAENTSLFLA